MNQVTDKQEFSYSAQEVKLYDYDHWLTTLFAPEDKRESLFAILAFNTEISRIRETVSEPMLGDIRLQWWREALAGLQNNISKTHPVVEALRETQKRNPLDFSLMQEMVDMRSKDLDHTPIETDENLIAYADGTGGALQRLMNSVLAGKEHSENIEAANRAGRAYALTGILRAIPFHAQNGLILVPMSRMEDAGVTCHTIFQEENRTNFLKIVSDLTELTGTELKNAQNAAHGAEPVTKAARSVNAISSVYLKRLKAAHFDPAHAKLTVGSQRKVLALLIHRLIRE